MRTLGLTMLCILAACRFRFDALAPLDAEPDAAIDASLDSPPDTPTLLGCTPVRFAMDGATKYMTAVATRRGYDVFAVSDTGVVRGYAYAFDAAGKLEPVAGTGNVLPVPDAIGPVGALALDPDPGDTVDVVIAVPYAISSGLTMNGGTVVVPFDAQLQRVDLPEMATMNDGLTATLGGLASGDNGTVLFLATDSGGFPGLQPVSRRGVASGLPRPVDSSGHTITRPTLIRGPTGYLGLWGDNAKAPQEAVAAAFIDDNLAAQPPVVVSVNPDHGSFLPAAAYLPRAHRYLIGWMEKPGRDFIKLSMRDEALRDAPGLIDIIEEGAFPIIAAGDNDFLVVWPATNGGPQKRLGAARVATDGTFALAGVTNTGGDESGFDVVVHNGQPALLWVEKSVAGGASLWVDALCP